MAKEKDAAPRYRQIYEELRAAIIGGHFAPGARMPSEAELADQYGTSRITLARAFQELQMHGYVERRVGAGTFVRSPEPMKELRFGLLIPDLGRTEIFEPICHGMAAAQSEAERFSLLWGNSQGPKGVNELGAEELCRHFLDVRVSGIFFAPFELTRSQDKVNRRIVSMCDDAGIPVVLLDRDLEKYPNRSRYDVVGIDNRRAGYMLTQHLLDEGCNRIAFIARPGSAPTVDARIMGYRDALLQNDKVPESRCVNFINPIDARAVSEALKEVRPDAVICANDVTSMTLMRTLTELGYAIPDDIRIASFDDVKYAELLMVPLTTIRQPCAEIGAEAIAAMLERVTHPGLPPRDIYLNFQLMVRESSVSRHDPKKGVPKPSPSSH